MEWNGLAGYGRGYMRPGMEWWVDKRKDGWKAATMDEWIDDSEGRGLGGYVRISIFISRTLRSANQQGVVGRIQINQSRHFWNGTDCDRTALGGTFVA